MHRSEIAEDYVKLIAELIGSFGEARTVDIADRLGVKSPTVTRNLSRLQRDGYILHERYRGVFLTEKGQELASKCEERHRVIMKFFLALGLDKKTAESETEGIERHVSPATLRAFQNFISRGSKLNLR